MRSRARRHISRSTRCRPACARASSPSATGMNEESERWWRPASAPERCAGSTSPLRPARSSVRSTGPRSGSGPRGRSHHSTSPNRSPITRSQVYSMMHNIHLALTVNGEAAEVAFAPYKTLLEILREDLALCGTKHGCELGECGACAVLVDGEPQLSCLLLAVECAGRNVETVEGLARGAELHPLQAAFADLGAAQCGYCTPGLLLTAKALLAENPRPATREVQEALAGNL